MNQDKIITQKITTKIDASIICATAGTRLDQSLWAINWFDLRRAWLYDLYNKVVFNHVRQIGAYPIFKGELSKIIHNDERLRREMLLIVKYPNAQSFLSMIAQKAFKIKSVLRTSSVRHFQFGFMQKLNQEETRPTSLKYDGKLKYLVHVLEGNTSIDTQSLIEFAANQEVFPHFIGEKSAMLGTQRNGGKLRTMDFMLNHVLIFSGFDSETLEAFIQTDFYQQFIQSQKFNFIGLYDRKI